MQGWLKERQGRPAGAGPWCVWCTGTAWVLGVPLLATGHHWCSVHLYTVYTAPVQWQVVSIPRSCHRPATEEQGTLTPHYLPVRPSHWSQASNTLSRIGLLSPSCGMGGRSRLKRLTLYKTLCCKTEHQSSFINDISTLRSEGQEIIQKP